MSLVALGTLGYHLVEGWSYFDARGAMSAPNTSTKLDT